MIGASENQLLTVSDVATRWQVSKDHVYHLTREGWLPCVELGRCRRYRLITVEAFEMAGGTSDRGGVRASRGNDHQPGEQAGQAGCQPREGEHRVGGGWRLKSLPDAAQGWIAVCLQVAQIALVLLVTPGETIQTQNIMIHPMCQPIRTSTESAGLKFAEGKSICRPGPTRPAGSTHEPRPHKKRTW